jgi:hypothetical protein
MSLATGASLPGTAELQIDTCHRPSDCMGSAPLQSLQKVVASVSSTTVSTSELAN